MMTFRGAAPGPAEQVILTSFQKSPVPAIEHEKIKIPGRPGALVVQRQHGERRIIAQFELNGKSAAANEALTAQLAQWAESEVPGQLVHEERPGVFYLAQLEEMSEPDLAEPFPTVELTFLCADPYAYSVALRSAAVGLPFTNEGNINAEPVITWTATGDYTGVQYSCGGKTLSILGYTLLAGHVLKIDCKNRLITDNGQADAIMQALSLESDWLTLAPGSSTVSGPGGTVTWRDTWL